MENVQSFFAQKCKFSTYILHFYKRSLEKFRHLFASYPLYDKSFYIDSNHTSFEKNHQFFENPSFVRFENT